MRLLFFCFVLCVFIFLFKKKLVNLWCILDNITGRFFSKWIGFLGWESNQEVVFGLVIGNVFLQKRKKYGSLKLSSSVLMWKTTLAHYSLYYIQKYYEIYAIDDMPLSTIYSFFFWNKKTNIACRFFLVLHFSL